MLKTIAAILLACCATVVHAAEGQATRAAYQKYISVLEERIDSQNREGSKFLWIDQDARRRDAVRKGEMPVERLDTPPIPGGTLEHWIGGEFLPGVTLERVIQVDQDYAKYTTYYAPEMIRARVLSRQGNHFTVLYRLKKHEVVTVVLDITNQVDFVPLGNDRYFVRSRSEDVREVQNPGKPDEKILPEGGGVGFLWDMNSYWRMEQRDGGVYLECEVVTLARSVPFGMGGLVRPIIKSLASESLTNLLKAKRHAVLAAH